MRNFWSSFERGRTVTPMMSLKVIGAGEDIRVRVTVYSIGESTQRASPHLFCAGVVNTRETPTVTTDGTVLKDTRCVLTSYESGGAKNVRG